MAMATPCDDVSARMVDLLYGELSSGERAEIDAHVAGCERCRSELEGFEKTRAVARQALDEAPPARVRAAILQAAAAHVAAQAQPARQAAAPDRVSFWDRLRVRWAFPTLATLGALAVFLVANRVFMNPERTMEKAHDAVQPAPAPAPVVQRASPSPVAPPTIDDRFAKAKAEAQSAPPPAAAAPERYGETAQEGARPHGHAKRVLDQAPKSRAISDDPLDSLVDEAASAKSASRAGNEKAYRRAEPGFAQPPPPREAPAAKPRAKEMDKSVAAPAMKKTASDDLLDSFPRESSRAGGGASASGPGAVGGLAGGRRNKADDYGSGAAAPNPGAPRAEAPKRPSPTVASAPAPAAAPPPISTPALSGQAKGDEADDAEGVPIARDADAKKQEKQEKKEKKAGGKASGAETLAQRADRLFSEGRWSEAAAAYRELLRQDPRSQDADRWRRRLVAAESADVSDRNASLAEKRAAEAKPAKAAAPKAAKAPSKKASSVLDADQ